MFSEWIFLASNRVVHVGFEDLMFPLLRKRSHVSRWRGQIALGTHKAIECNFLCHSLFRETANIRFFAVTPAWVDSSRVNLAPKITQLMEFPYIFPCFFDRERFARDCLRRQFGCYVIAAVVHFALLILLKAGSLDPEGVHGRNGCRAICGNYGREK
jgi:hypothetical protein